MKIRDCKISEKAEMAVLMKAFYEEEEHQGLINIEDIPSLIENLFKYRQEKVYCLMLEHENAIVGYMVGSGLYSNEYNGFVFFLDEFMICAHARAGGLGSLAMQTLDTWLMEQGFRGVMLETTKYNDRARNFYTKNGYELSSRSIMYRLLKKGS